QVPKGSTVTLNGSLSRDLDYSDELIYTWIAPNGIVLSDTESPIVTFEAPDVTDTLYFTLGVNDGVRTSSDWSALDLFISEYSQGDYVYIEIYNGTGQSVNMSEYEIWAMKWNDFEGYYEDNHSTWPNRKFVFDPNYTGDNDPTINNNMYFGFQAFCEGAESVAGTVDDPQPELQTGDTSQMKMGCEDAGVCSNSDYFDEIACEEKSGSWTPGVPGTWVEPDYLKNNNIMQLQNEANEVDDSWYNQCKYIISNPDCNDNGVANDPCDELILPNN
ncbi:uncharacterized protein METZ01_LOCUS417241, partial [marine metagenome]